MFTPPFKPHDVLQTFRTIRFLANLSNHMMFSTPVQPYDVQHTVYTIRCLAYLSNHTILSPPVKPYNFYTTFQPIQIAAKLLNHMSFSWGAVVNCALDPEFWTTTSEQLHYNSSGHRRAWPAQARASYIRSETYVWESGATARRNVEQCIIGND